jgi:tetratricopeptide (TPR) repeat protein
MKRFATLTIILLAGALVCAQAQVKKPKSQKEAQAVNAIIQAQDPDSRIKAADELVTNYADSDFKAFALYLEAESYAQKGSNEKTIVFGEQALQADPKNYQALVLLAKTYAATTHVNDLDKEEKLTKAEKYAQDGLDAVKTAEKPNPNLADDQWTEAKNDFNGQLYLALGIVAVYRNKIDDVTANFQKVSELDSDPTDLIRAGRALLDAKKPDQAVVWFDKAANAPKANAQVKNIANSDKTRAEAMMKK